MKKKFFIILLTFVSIASSAVTKSEFLDIVGEKRGFGGLYGYIELYKDGTGFYSSNFMAGLGGLYEFGSMVGLGNVDIECDGAVASCNYRCNIALKWQFSNGKVTLRYTKVSGHTEASIVGWSVQPYAGSTVDCVKQELRKRLARDKAMVGTTDVFEVAEIEHGQYGLQVPSDNPLAKLATFIMVGSYPRESSSSSNQSSYSVKEPVIVEATYPDGDYNIKNFISNKLTYPTHLRKKGYSKSATYTLIISPEGRVSDAWTTDDVDSKLESATKQLLMKLPKRFKSKTIDGNKVEGQYTVNISYYVDPVMEFDVQKVNFKYTGGEEKIRVYSKQQWDISSTSSSNFAFRKNGDYIIISCPERGRNDYDQISEKLVVSTLDNAFSYDIKIIQDGAPKPFIRPSETQVNLPRKKKDARYIVTVESNRDWKVQAKNPESKINMQRVDSRLIFTAPTNNGKQNRDATFTLVSTDKDCQKDIVVTQFGRDADKYTSSGTKHSSSFLELYEDYYDNYGSLELGFVDVQLGAGCTMPLFSVENGEKVLTTEPYFPLNFEVGYLRFHFVELSLLNFRLDLSTDGKEGFAWEPQIRGLIPVSERWALMPYVGPVCQINTDGNEKSVWSASGGLMARVRYGKLTHTNFSIGYKGGPWGGLAIGVSIGWSLGW